MTEGDNKAIVRAFFDRLSAGDAGGMFALLSDDMVWTLTGTTPASGTYRGHDDVMENFLKPVLSRLKDGQISVDLHELIGQGERVVALLSGRAQGLHGPYNNTYCHVMRVRDGKIVETTEFVDTALVETALYGHRFVPR